MKAFGITNQSAYLRAMALKGYLLKVNLPEIRELIRLMKNLTNNVNQIARKLNEQGSVYETEMDDIRQRLDELWDITNQLLSRLETARDWRQTL
jgi:small-conductance mechanosensitive channel